MGPYESGSEWFVLVMASTVVEHRVKSVKDLVT
jgi:hypothetical protein